MYIFAHDGHDHLKEIAETAQNNNLGFLIIAGTGVALVILIAYAIHKLKK